MACGVKRISLYSALYDWNYDNNKEGVHYDIILKLIFLMKDNWKKGKNMIDLVNSGAQIQSIKEPNLDLGSVKKQNSKSITVDFLDIDTFRKVYRTYVFPNAFLDREIVVRGEANSVLLHCVEIAEQLKAINTSLKTLGLNVKDPAYQSLDEKRIKIENELAGIQSVFEEKVKAKDIADYNYYIERDEKELQDNVINLVGRIEFLKYLQAKYESLKYLRNIKT